MLNLLNEEGEHVIAEQYLSPPPWHSSCSFGPAPMEISNRIHTPSYGLGNINSLQRQRPLQPSQHELKRLLSLYRLSTV